jgi:regulator of PEP synthase PpsR (kinase-PPPase family)
LSVYIGILKNMTQTNRSLKGWHAELNKSISYTKVSLYKFISKIINKNKSTFKKSIRLAAEERFLMNKNYFRRNERLVFFLTEVKGQIFVFIFMN